MNKFLCPSFQKMTVHTIVGRFNTKMQLRSNRFVEAQLRRFES